MKCIAIKARLLKFALDYSKFIKFFYYKIPPIQRLKIKSLLVRFLGSNIDYNYERIEAPDLRYGVNLIGYPFSPSGVGKMLYYLALDFIEKGIPINIYDFSSDIAHHQKSEYNILKKYESRKLIYKTNIWCVNIHNMRSIFTILGKNFFAEHYNIGYFPWELEVLPEENKRDLELVDEIWGVSEFNSESIRKKADKIVRTVSIPVKCAADPKYTRKYFNLPEDKFLFLYYFDLSSSVARKNPQAVIEAFTKGFAVNDDVCLVLKTKKNYCLSGKYYEKDLNTLLKLIANNKNIIMIDEVLTFEEVIGLNKVCNCFISLHRSEGFGIGIAESLYLGNYAIATGYSGNLDFMHKEEYRGRAFLVDYKLVPVKKSEYFMINDEDGVQVWAQPDIDDAISKMKVVIDKSKYH